MYNMDETAGDEVTALDAVVSPNLPSKASEHSLKPSGSSNAVEPRQIVTLSGADCDDHSTHFLTDLLEGRNLDRIGSLENGYDSAPGTDGGSVMVEELTLQNYTSENLAIVATSKNREMMQARHKPWPHLRHSSGSSRSGVLGEASYEDKEQAPSSIWEDAGFTYSPESLGQIQKRSNNKDIKVSDNWCSKNDGSSSHDLSSSGGIRTKILSKSGFSEYFIKNTLNGKGVICKGPAHRGSGNTFGFQTRPGSTDASVAVSNEPIVSSTVGTKASDCIAGTRHHGFSNAYQDGFNLREWLQSGRNKVNKAESLCVFRQIVDLVDFAHAKGIVLHDLRPSCFKLLKSNQVMYLGSSACPAATGNIMGGDVPTPKHRAREKRPLDQYRPSSVSQCKKPKICDKLTSVQICSQSLPQNISKADFCGPQCSRIVSIEENTPISTQGKSSSPCTAGASHPLLTPIACKLEEKWYSSPEQINGGHSTFSSNIYCLGVLLFELLGLFDSGRSRAAAMLDLRHRILPPDFLSENPKEAGFCLWLLHPDPSSRPKTRDILQSEVMSSIQELPLRGDELSRLSKEDVESDLLLYFLLSLHEKMQKDAAKLRDEIECIETDIKEVGKRQLNNFVANSSSQEISLARWENGSTHQDQSGPDVYSEIPPAAASETKMMKDMNQLENAYFSMRSKIQGSDADLTTQRSQELLRSRENDYRSLDDEKYTSPDRVGVFFDGLCKYARYSKFKVRGTVRNGDFNSSANVICSLSFDRDEEYLAAAGVSKKIKIFEFQSLFKDSVDIHYPVIEMANRSKLSCVCWNNYIRNYLASTDYDGVVKLWDAASGEAVSQFAEHHERAWSVDFSRVDPKRLVSGGDDHLVKLWSLNEKGSFCTIRNNTNVCCVQFSAQSSHLLAYSSADFRTYCYDLRNVSTPWCILAGHEKAVSYAKFLDAETLVSSSTDNTLKIWDLKKTTSSGLSTDACILTLRGHTNEKNFVGLSVADGYIACGSETNQVFAYYKSLPMPITSYKFGSIDPISGKETEDANGQFVSNVCWRRKSDMIVAASSSGCIKLLQMV